MQPVQKRIKRETSPPRSEAAAFAGAAARQAVKPENVASGSSDLMSVSLPELSLKFASRKVWLVKVPHFLADSWKKAGPDTELGKVKITTKGPNSEVSLTLAPAAAGQIPQEYNLLSTAQPLPPMFVISETEEGHVAAEGAVKTRCDLVPVNASAPEYRAIVQQRNIASTTKTRHVAEVQDVRELALRAQQKHRSLVSVNPLQPNAPAPQQNRRLPQAPTRNLDKRERMERSDLLDLLFQKFERRPHYTLKELVTVTEQPEAYLKEVLADLCVYNKRGPNKSTYELKPEYKGKAT
jgi:transcription initiation factor TFIIF subunit beta